jgi:hypothetical protein
MPSRPDRVSLIMPSHCDRAHFVARALAHLEEQGFRGEIVVSDHSPSAQTAVPRTLCETDYVAVHADDGIDGSNVRDGYGDADRLFLQRAGKAGSLENKLVDYCHSRVR